MHRASGILVALFVIVPLCAGVGTAQPLPSSEEGADGITSVPDDLILIDGDDGESAVLQIAALMPATTAVLVTMEDFADALASGVLQGDAVLLPSTRNALVEGVRQRIAEDGIREVIVIGGQAAISDAAVAMLPEDVAVSRIAGAERTETAANIARQATDGERPYRVLLARARGTQANPSSGFIDAVAAGAWSAATGWPVLLVDTWGPSAATTAAMADLDPREVVVLGGSAAISEEAAAATADGRPVIRIAGETRYATAAGIALRHLPEGADTAFLLDGTDPDVWQPGLAAAHPSAAGEEDGAVLLADGQRLPQPTADALADLAPQTLHCVADLAVCLQARSVAGRPDVVEVAVDPPAGRPLPAGARVSVSVPADAEVSVVDDGGCVTFDSPTAGRAGGGSCTVVLRVAVPGGVAQTTTVSWPAIAVDTDVAVGPADHALMTLGDRWDFSDPIDARVDAMLGADAAGARVDPGAGVLDLGTAGDRVTVPLLWPGFPGAVPVSPDGLVNPIDADRHRVAIIRLHSPQASGLDLEWRTCAPAPAGNCIDAPVQVGRASAAVQSGWQTVVMDLGQQPAWSGEVHFVYLSAAAGTRIDDVRLVPALSGAGIAIEHDPATTLVWDTDADPANNTDPSSSAWGVVADGRLDADRLPPGRYWLHTDAGDTVGPVTLATPPAPVVTSPSVATAEEYGRDVRGDPWDMSPGVGPAGTDDLAAIGGVQQAAVTDGVLRAANSGGDPHVVLTQPTPFDGSVFHTVTVDFAVDGPLDLSFGPGGGTHGRILYRHQGDPHWRDGAPIVAYGNQRSFAVDMRHPAATAQGPAWTAAPITAVRFDPNEDPAAGRGWTLADVRITGDVISAGQVQLAARDAGVDAGVDRQATFFASTDPAARGSAVAGPVPLTAGEASAAWSTCGVAPGRWWITAEIAGAGVAAATSTVPVVVPGDC